MARTGTFNAEVTFYGAPLSSVHPTDNRFPRFDPEIEALKGLSDEERAELQRRLEEVYASLQLGRDFFLNP